MEDEMNQNLADTTAAMKSGALTESQVIASAAKTNRLNKQVKGVIEFIFSVAMKIMKKAKKAAAAPAPCVVQDKIIHNIYEH